MVNKPGANTSPTVLILGTWIDNIGNGFIDKGARVQVERAFPDADIVEASGYPNHIGDIRASLNIPQKLRRSLGLGGVHDQPTHPYRQQMTNVAEYVDPDLIVLPGCVLYEWVYRKYRPCLDRLPTEDTPFVLLGAGGGNYSAKTQRKTREFVNDYSVDAILTRDSTAYSCYSGDVEHSYDGIDCAFFINEWFDPPISSRAFDAYTFDKTEEPDRRPENEIIRPCHTPFGRPFHTDVGDMLRSIRSEGAFEGDNLLFSDRLEDYLFVYSNAKMTLSDRVHAVVPTLAYGGEAQFIYSTPRDQLFEKVTEKDIHEEPVSVESSRLDAVKQQQIDSLREIVFDLTEDFAGNSP